MTSAIVQSLNRLAEAWWPFALHSTWTSCLVAVTLLLLVRRARRWPARVRHAVLLIALVKFALPPTLALPVGLFHWFGPTVLQGFSDAPAGQVAGAASVFGWGDLTWKAWLFVLYSWGTLLAAGVIVRQMFRVRRIVRGSTVVTSGAVHNRLVHLSKRMGLRRPIRLLVSSRPIAPMAFGLLRPSVLTPVSVHNHLPADQVETVLAHELAHHRRGDLWLNWFQILLQVVWWFNPILRVLNRAIRQAGEDCCDDLLLAGRVTTSEGYCQALLRVAAELGRQPMLGGAMGFAESVHPLSERMRRLMDPHLKRPARLPVAALAPMILLAALVLPGLPSRANPQTAMEILPQSTAVAQADAPAPHSATKELQPEDPQFFATAVDPMLPPQMCSATPVVFPRDENDSFQPRQTKASPSDEFALLDAENDNADDVTVPRLMNPLAAGAPPLAPQPTFRPQRRLMAGVSEGGYPWTSSASAPFVSEQPAGQGERILPESTPDRMDMKQQYADGNEEEPKPMRMPSLPGEEDNDLTPEIKKLQAPASQPKSPQLASDSPKRLLRVSEKLLAALTPRDRLSDTRRLDEMEIWKQIFASPKLRDDPLTSASPSYVNEPVWLDEPIVLAEAPQLFVKPDLKNDATPILPDTVIPPYLPDLASKPLPSGPCAVPEPLALCLLGPGLIALLRRRKA
ncbi:MAG: hypothetical protein JW849_03590 [Phycisphaerae bacterium]|nr:hypothetical protein [Phycisphaerae bacterium]